MPGVTAPPPLAPPVLGATAPPPDVIGAAPPVGEAVVPLAPVVAAAPGVGDPGVFELPQPSVETAATELRAEQRTRERLLVIFCFSQNR